MRQATLGLIALYLASSSHLLSAHAHAFAHGEFQDAGVLKARQIIPPVRTTAGTTTTTGTTTSSPTLPAQTTTSTQTTSSSTPAVTTTTSSASASDSTATTSSSTSLSSTTSVVPAPPPIVTSGPTTTTNAAGKTQTIIRTQTFPAATTTAAVPSQSDSAPPSSGLGSSSIIGLSVAGGVALLGIIGFFIWKLTRKRLSDFDDNEAIKWPEFNNKESTSHALPVNTTGRAGFDIIPNGSDYANSTHDLGDPYAPPPLPHVDPRQPPHALAHETEYYNEEPDPGSEGYMDSIAMTQFPPRPDAQTPYNNNTSYNNTSYVGRPAAQTSYDTQYMGHPTAPNPYETGYPYDTATPNPYDAGRQSPGPQAGRMSPGAQDALGYGSGGMDNRAISPGPSYDAYGVPITQSGVPAAGRQSPGLNYAYGSR